MEVVIKKRKKISALEKSPEPMIKIIIMESRKNKSFIPLNQVEERLIKRCKTNS